MKAMIVLADGFEEIEAFTTIDVLERAGIEVTKTGLISKIVTSAHRVKIMTDKTLNEIKNSDYDILILPGGPGTNNLINSAALMKVIREFDKEKKTIAAICAAPVALAKAGILDDKVAVVYPGLESKIPKVRDAKVIAAGHVITSKAPGTAMDFAFMIVERTLGKKVVTKIKEKMVV